MVDTKQTKTVGEHHVASELARRGWAPALTRDGLERTDILAVHTVGRRQIEVQVKPASRISLTTMSAASPADIRNTSIKHPLFERRIADRWSALEPVHPIPSVSRNSQESVGGGC